MGPAGSLGSLRLEGKYIFTRKATEIDIYISSMQTCFDIFSHQTYRTPAVRLPVMDGLGSEVMRPV